MLIVQKYGGSSVATVDHIRRVAKKISNTFSKGHQVVVVLSAQGDTTDSLLNMASELSNSPSKREIDMLLATGEQQSVALMSLAIQQLGYPSISLNAQQSGISSSREYSDARIENVTSTRIQAEIEKGKIVIVTGFQGVNEYGDTTTLGRGGSDTSAVALAAKLNADLCEIYTDVDGIYSADPRLVPNAIKLDQINYDETLEMASLGAKVLNSRSVEMAKNFKVPLVVRSSFNDKPGTIVKELSKMERTLVSGVTLEENVSTISITGITDCPGMAYKIFSLLAKEKISIDIILQSVGRNNTKDIAFSLKNTDKKAALIALENLPNDFYYEKIIDNDDVSKLSVIGAGMEAHPEVAALMFEALYREDINIKMISTSEIKISVIIDKKHSKIGTKSVHDIFIGENKQI